MKNRVKGKQKARNAEMAKRSKLANDSKVNRIIKAVLEEPDSLILIPRYKVYGIRFKGVPIGWTRFTDRIEAITVLYEKKVNVKLDFNIPILEKHSDPTEQERQAKQDEVNPKDLGSVLNAILGTNLNYI